MRPILAIRSVPLFLSTAVLMACSPTTGSQEADSLAVDKARRDARVRPEIYVPVRLTADLGALDPGDTKMLPLLIEAAQIMDTLFWYQAWGAPDSIPLKHPTPELRAFFRMNYGPWDRMAADAPFVDGVGQRPKGARFYPEDMSVEEFEAWDDPGKKGLYTMIGRNADGKLVSIPYNKYFSQRVKRAADLLDQAAQWAQDPGWATYLAERAAALRTDQYRASDLAWMEMRNNDLDLIIGPIETYEDQLFGYKASYEAYVLLKDKEWTARLEHFAKLLPGLQQGLPVPPAYKQEKPGTDGQLGAYDVLYYAGACNAGGKTIAVNLPNDESIQLEKGTRRLQLKNAMRAKFDKILVPIAQQLIDPGQVHHITFDAFFENVMFHEVAHGLGIKHTINGRGTVRDALLDEAAALEEGKADILGLYMVEQLREQGELTEGELMDNYVTFLAGIFRSVRFGATSAHGRANMLRFNYFLKAGAFHRDPAKGIYRVDAEKMHQAIIDLSALILRLQGDGDLEGVQQLMAAMGNIGEELRSDLDRLSRADIPVDVVFEQGAKVLGLGPGE